jgi:hypothetical protein
VQIAPARAKTGLLEITGTRWLVPKLMLAILDGEAIGKARHLAFRFM